MPAKAPCIVCWSEATAPEDVYPNDINTAVAEGLRKAMPEAEVVVAGLDQPDQGIPADLLDRCTVLVWWGHAARRVPTCSLKSVLQNVCH